MPNVTGFIRPAVVTIIDRIKTDINTRVQGAEARLRRGVLGNLAKTWGGAIHLLYGFICFIAQNVIVDTARAEWLVRHASIWGVARKAASFATGSITIMGSEGIVVPSGSILQRPDGQQFSIDAQVSIASGTATAAVTSLVAGIIGNTDTGTLFNFVNPIQDIDVQATVVSPGVTGGEDEETNEQLRVRVLRRIQEPPHGGTEQDYVTWALEVAGVTRAWAFANELGLGTVTLRFVKDDKAGTIIPDANEVQEVQTYLDTKRPVTAAVTVAAPVSTSLDMTIALSPDTTENRTAVETELKDLMLRDGKPGATIFLSRLREAISLAVGEFSHVLTVPSANVTHTDAQLPQLGTITWT